MIRRAFMGGLLLALASAPLCAHAQDETKPKRPPTPRPLVQAVVVPTAKPAPNPGTTYLALPALLSPGASFTGSGFGSGRLASGGLRSNLPVIGDPAPICRATCAKTRYVCLSTADATDCDPRWTQCVADCAR